jgi:hypothetical protein
LSLLKRFLFEPAQHTSFCHDQHYARMINRMSQLSLPYAEVLKKKRGLCEQPLNTLKFNIAFYQRSTAEYQGALHALPRQLSLWAHQL